MVGCRCCGCVLIVCILAYLNGVTRDSTSNMVPNDLLSLFSPSFLAGVTGKTEELYSLYLLKLKHVAIT